MLLSLLFLIFFLQTRICRQMSISRKIKEHKIKLNILKLRIELKNASIS